MLKCEKCKKQLHYCNDWRSRPSRHHIYPRRWFGGDKRGNTEKVTLCQQCHTALERVIACFEARIIAKFYRRRHATPTWKQQQRLFCRMDRVYVRILTDFLHD